MLIRLELDRPAALHLSYALGRHRAYCDEHDYYLPAALEELARFAEAAKTGRTEADIPRGDGDTGTDAPLTRKDFAARIGKTDRTVRRWERAGKLTATVAGIPRSELERLTKGRTHAART